MNRRNEEILKRKALADSMNFAPPTEGENFLIFGERKECIKPTLLNQAREMLGFNPRHSSMFEQCRAKNPKRRN